MISFEKIFRALNDANVKYLAIGGTAVNLYGHKRFTGDIDMLLLLTKENIEKLDRVLKKIGYTERLPVSLKELGDLKKVKRWIKEKNLKAFTMNPPPSRYSWPQVDIVVNDSLRFEKFYKKRRMGLWGSLMVPIVNIHDLISMKKKAGRPQDKLDLEKLLGLHGLCL